MNLSRLFFTLPLGQAEPHPGYGFVMMMVPSSPPPSVLPSFFGTRRRRGGGGGGWIMTDVSILVMVALSFVFQFSDATIGTRTAEEDFTWKYNGEVNIGESRVLCPIEIDLNVKNMDFLHVLQILLLAKREK